MWTRQRDRLEMEGTRLQGKTITVIIVSLLALSASLSTQPVISGGVEGGGQWEEKKVEEEWNRRRRKRRRSGMGRGRKEVKWNVEEEERK
ncbi:hypothetical protein Pcinc_043771 [Petrolisthes cinctipes]|uniref:Uncharacterized protein n=1 Tax=Petrolisthes cinctipes TaxID=88211 RepID=A0AAE1EEX7_PETCI|nr:hypothetical protein Pcinc_043771 [Petrolisthes cinctipes]